MSSTGTGGSATTTTTGAGGGSTTTTSGGSTTTTTTTTGIGGAGGGTTTSVTGTGGGTTTTGTGGQGGGPTGVVCTALAWAGDPLFVGSQGGGSAVRPRLLPVTGNVALAFEEPHETSVALETRTLDPWGAWPPMPGMIGSPLTAAGGQTPIAVGRHVGIQIVYAGAAAFGHMRIGQTTPGESVVDGLTTELVGDAKFVAREPLGGFLVGHGADADVNLFFVPSLAADGSTFKSLGSLGCAKPRAVADVAVAEPQAFLVASTNRAPFHDCPDPTNAGPPVVVQVARVTAKGWEQGSFVHEAKPIVDLQMAARPGGAWVAYRVEADPVLRILKIDAQGHIAGQLMLAGSPTGGDAVAAWSDGLAHVATSPGRVRLDAQDSAGSASIELDSPMLSPVDRPSVISSEDGRSFLVAFQQSGPDVIGLLRADCAP